MTLDFSSPLNKAHLLSLLLPPRTSLYHQRMAIKETTKPPTATTWMKVDALTEGIGQKDV
jgi:hypothetical protein